MEGGLGRPPEARETEPEIQRQETTPKRQDPVKEPAMNEIIATLLRDLTCAAAAVLISIVVGTSFVQSTATAPGTHAAAAMAAQQA
jgi:hypothetical protein